MLTGNPSNCERTVNVISRAGYRAGAGGEVGNKARKWVIATNLRKNNCDVKQPEFRVSPFSEPSLLCMSGLRFLWAAPELFIQLAVPSQVSSHFLSSSAKVRIEI